MLNIEIDPTVGSKLMSHFSRYSALARQEILINELGIP
jgi:hypothetical protein